MSIIWTLAISRLRLSTLVSALRRLQAAADTAAQKYQGLLMGHYVPAGNLWRLFSRPWSMWRSTGHVPRIGAVFLFSIALPLAVFLFEAYASHRREAIGYWFLAAYIALFAGIGVYYHAW